MGKSYWGRFFKTQENFSLLGSKNTETPSTSINSEHRNNEAPLVEVVIEIPRGSFLKRGSTGELDFISPLPCPFNYGSVPAFIGQDGDLLDAVVLGPRLPLGTTININAWGAVRMIDRGTYDDKLICSLSPISLWKQRLILIFFMIYSRSKSLLNFIRGHKGRNSCEGWLKPEDALSKTTPRTHIV